MSPPDRSFRLPEPQFGERLNQLLPGLLHGMRPSKVLVIADETVAHLHGPALRPYLDADWVLVPSGEQHKTLATCQRLWQACYDAGLDRQAVVVALGGGVVGDMAGFVAATWKRGLRLVLAPSTLLAMVDAAHGGKVAVDFAGGKNLVGSFFPPEAVICAMDLLGTLPPRELRAGYAEMLKHELIGARPQGLLELDPLAVPAADWLVRVQHSVQFKLSVVRQDPYERGMRQILNFGHTVGHALEGALLGTPYEVLHGEAVAMGMAVEAQLSAQAGLLPQSDADAVRAALHRMQYPLQLPAALDWQQVAALLQHDKKNQDGRIQVVLLNRIGEASFGHHLSAEHILTTIREVLA